MQCGSLLLLGARVAVDDSRESHHNAMIPSESSITLRPNRKGVLSNKSRGPLFLKHLAGSFVLSLAARNSQPMGRRPADARHALPRCPHCGAGPPQPTLESVPRFLMDRTPAALEAPPCPPKKTRGPLAVPFLQPVEKGTIPPVGRLPSLPFLSAPNRPSPTSSCPHSFWRQPHHTLLTHPPNPKRKTPFCRSSPPSNAGIVVDLVASRNPRAHLASSDRTDPPF